MEFRPPPTKSDTDGNGTSSKRPIGDADAVPIASRMVPLLMIYAVAISASFVPAASIVQEKEKGTINSVLVTPTTVNDFLGGKAGLGIVLGMSTGIITLILNNAFGAHPFTMLLILFIAAVMMAEIGLILGIFAYPYIGKAMLSGAVKG